MTPPNTPTPRILLVDDNPTNLQVLYQTLDGAETGYWDADQKSWVKDDSYRSAVKHGFAVADKASAPDLLTAPIPAPRGRQS